MGRNRVFRHVLSTPAVKGFKPYGRLNGKRHDIVLLLDEYEAIRLLDHEYLTQAEAARVMQISRPTLTRIYDSARCKFAAALVEGANLLIEGGDVKLKEHVFWCEDCGSFIETGEKYLFHCPLCEGPHLVTIDECYQYQCKECGKCYHGGKHARI
jgi:predicted DNA-binding protein (UPF0251 family)